VTDIGVKSAGTADPGLGYGVGAADAVDPTVGTADDGGDTDTTGDEGDSLTRTGAGAGETVCDAKVDGLAVFSLAATFEP
jgi:hypothetical protein